jgi:hypothetical protein
MLKLARRGNFYGKGKSNADTFWKSVLRAAPVAETLQVEYPPSAYYHTTWEPADGSAPVTPDVTPAQRIKSSG